MFLLISPRNQGPLKIIAALPSLNSAVISAVEGSAGRIWSLSSHLRRYSRAFTLLALLMAGFAPPSKTYPPDAFCRAAW